MAGDLHLRTLRGSDATRFGRVAAGLLQEVEQSGTPTLLIAELAGEAILLGRHQRASSALSASALAGPVARRAGGGRAIAAGAGRFGVALALPEAGALLSGPIGADKIINRYVRGLNAGLTACGAGAGAHYFGRDFVSAEGRQIGVVSQDGTPGGAVLFEAVVAIERSLSLPEGARGYPVHGDPRADGPPHGALAELWRGPRPFEEIADAIARGYERVYGVSVTEGEAAAPAPERTAEAGAERARAVPAEAGAAPIAESAGELFPPVREEEAGFEESGVADIPIGFVEALMKADGDVLREVRLRGDFVAPAFVVQELEQSLTGRPLEFGALGAAVDEAFRRPGAAILGITRMRILPDAILAAAGRL